MNSPFKTVLIGCGQVAAGYGIDPQYKKFYRYATHADVLAEHPDFKWVAAIDPSEKARAAIIKRYPSVMVYASSKEIPTHLMPLEVAVIATPPAIRLELLSQLPKTIKALIVEKPLGQSVAECNKFLQMCRKRRIAVQMNLWRRADKLHRQLAAGRLSKLIGALQGIQVVYDGALDNTGTHIFDCLEMLSKSINSVQALTDGSALLQLSGGITVAALALPKRNYRKLIFDFWGAAGRLNIGQEGLRIEFWGIQPHRALPEMQEVAFDEAGKRLTPTTGEAFYHLYTNLAATLRGKAELWAPGKLAARTAHIIEALKQSARSNGTIISV